ncbi:Cytochrome P450 11B1 [Manis pentadactyla]|nr:Cytochrome P450 11B1 [Manis pentadactyla]
MVSVTSEQHELHTTSSTELSGPQWRLHGLLADITYLRGPLATPVVMMSVKTQRLGDPEQGPINVKLDLWLQKEKSKLLATTGTQTATDPNFHSLLES